MNLMVINGLSCLLLFPAVAMDMSRTAAVSYSGDEAACVASSLVSSLVAHTSVLAMTAVGFDQYLAVMEPLEYSTKVTKAFSIQLIVSVWLAGTAAATVSALQLATSAVSPWASCRYTTTIKSIATINMRLLQK